MQFTVSAQTGSYLKYDLNGKTISHKNDDLNVYNKYEPTSEDTKAHNKHVFYVSYAVKGVYKLDITIHTPPHTAPVVGTLPYVPIVFSKSSPYPSAYLSITKMVGDDFEFFASIAGNKGHIEITKVANGWVEGTFELDMRNQYSDDAEPLHITNGSFRFKIDKEMED